MIGYSDNNALSLLVARVGKPADSQTFEELGLLDPFSKHYKEHEYTLTVDQYVVFLRVLYNASYLSREMSEKVLDLLAKTEFRQGLVEGVPPKILVAHKFGERIWEDTSPGKELHDCGIIYHPAHPYTSYAS